MKHYNFLKQLTVAAMMMNSVNAIVTCTRYYFLASVKVWIYCCAAARRYNHLADNQFWFFQLL